MRKIIVLGGALASLVILTGCDQITGTAPKVETPPAVAPTGTPAETPSVVAPIVPEYAGDLVFDALDPSDWTIRNGNAASTDTGLMFKLEDRGAAIAMNNQVKVDIGDTFTASITISATAPGRIRARIQSHCGSEIIERSIKGVTFEAGETEFSLNHTFESAHPCARLQLDAIHGPIEFEMQKILLTREAQ